MPASATLIGPLFHDGLTWTALDSRRILGALSTADTGTAAAAHPHQGVITGLPTSLQVTAGSGLTVKVAAGYCAVRHPTSGQGAYLTGLMAQATLSLATADPSNPRIDLVCARISDLGTSSSSSDVEVVTGTPASSPVAPALPSAAISLATVAVAAAATVPGTITDLRNWTAPPGGIIPITNAAAAPAAPSSQVFWNLATGKLCRGSGTAGTVLGLTSGSGPVLSAVNTSTGAQGLTPGSTGSGGPVPWGIGHGILGYGDSRLSTDGYTAAEITRTWTADGTTDYEIACKWQLAVPADLWNGGAGIDDGQVTYLLSVDGATVDTVTQFVADAVPGQGGAAAWFTSAAFGTTPARGAHTATLSIMTARTHLLFASGVIIGDMRDAAHTLFGSGAPTGWCSALVAENCYVAVIPVPAS
jgi:hypothetical protein